MSEHFIRNGRVVAEHQSDTQVEALNYLCERVLNSMKIKTTVNTGLVAFDPPWRNCGPIRQ